MANPILKYEAGDPIAIFEDRCTPRLRAELMRRLEGLTIRIVKDDAAWDRTIIWDLYDEEPINGNS